MTGFNGVWSETRKEELRQFLSSGCTFKQAAERMGLHKNQIAGKAWRLGIKTRKFVDPDERAAREAMKVRKKRKVRKKVRGVNPAWRTHEGSLPPVDLKKFSSDPDEVPQAQRRSLLELRNEHCRYPYGEGSELFFCGAAEADFAGVEGSGCRPYCERHMALAYNGRGA